MDQSGKALQMTNLKKLAPWLAVIAILALAAIVLRAEGRLWLSASGQIKLWVSDVWSSENSQQLLDPYSFTHLLHGFVFSWLTAWLVPRWPLPWRLVLTVGLETAWEMFENTPFVIDRYRSETGAIGYEGDTVLNSLGDILSCAVGMLIACRLGWRWSLAIFIAIEVVLLLWIRDCLLLNVLMLLVSLPAVKQWQMGH
jgi:hypothetical protein